MPNDKGRKRGKGKRPKGHAPKPTPSFRAMPTGLPFDEATTAKKLLDAAWKLTGLPPRYPLDTRGMISLVKICGYDASRDNLAYHFQQGYIPRPTERQGTSYLWSEAEVIAFMNSLESTRTWVAGSGLHEHKFRPSEKQAYAERLAGEAAFVQSLRTLGPLDLIWSLVELPDREQREVAAATLMEKLDMGDPRGPLRN